MGARIDGIGLSTIRVEPRRPAALTHRLSGDYIEAGIWGVVGAITGGEITGAAARDLEAIAASWRRWACTWIDEAGWSSGRRRYRRTPDHDGLWPGFPSDIVSLVTVLATQARGRTASRLVCETASLRARAAQRDARRPVSLRSAPDHRDRPKQAEGAQARQPRLALGHGVDWPPRCPPKGEAASRRSRRSTRGMHPGGAPRSWARKVEQVEQNNATSGLDDLAHGISRQTGNSPGSSDLCGARYPAGRMFNSSRSGSNCLTSSRTPGSADFGITDRRRTRIRGSVAASTRFRRGLVFRPALEHVQARIEPQDEQAG